MAASGTRNPSAAAVSEVVNPPLHPTYDLRAVVALALSEDAGDRGAIRSLSILSSSLGFAVSSLFMTSNVTNCDGHMEVWEFSGRK